MAEKSEISPDEGSQSTRPVTVLSPPKCGRRKEPWFRERVFALFFAPWSIRKGRGAPPSDRNGYAATEPRFFLMSAAKKNEDTLATVAYRKVIADLAVCEERYQGLVDAIPSSNEARLQAVLATLRSEVQQRKRLEAELLPRSRPSVSASGRICTMTSASAWGPPP